MAADVALELDVCRAAPGASGGDGHSVWQLGRVPSHTLSTHFLV